MHLSEIISSLFFAACAIYFVYALYIISNSAKTILHWLFFCCCLDLSLWSFSFSIGNVADNYDTALFWYRVAAVGWSSIFSYLLHCILIFTKNEILKKKWVYFVIYIPAIINIIVFSVYSKTANLYFKIIQTNFGWIQKKELSFLSLYFNVYSLSFALIGIILIIRWRLKSTDTLKNKTFRFIGGLYFVALIIGGISDYTINYFFREKIPQLAMIVIIIPVSLIMLYIRKKNLVNTVKCKHEPEANQILSENTKLKIYFYLSITYVIAGFVNFGVQFFSQREKVEDIILFSSIIFGIGALVGLIQNFKIKNEYKQLLSNIAFIISIPVMIIKYINVSSIYAWAVPVILMLVAIAFNQRQMLYMIWGSTFATFIWLWIKVPVLTTTFTSTDHMTRFIILTIILWFVFYINHTYIEIINMNKEKVKLEKLLNHVSNIFLTTNGKNINCKMVEAMTLCGNHFNLEYVNLSFYSERTKEHSYYEWYSPDSMLLKTASVKDTIKKILSIMYPDNVISESVLITDGYRNADENKKISKLMKKSGMKSLIVRPMKDKNGTIGLLCQASASRVLKWGEPQQQMTNLLVHLIIDIWTKLEAEKELYYQANYDMLTGLPNRLTFFKQLKIEIDKAEANGKLVGVIFIDIDTFKAVNDSMGHESGDSILIQIGKILQECISPNDFLARFGGDEFLLMIPQIDNIEVVESVAKRLTESFHKSFLVKDQEFHMSASTGISIYPYDGTDSEILIKNADLAMYKSKEQGKNQYTFCTEEMKYEVLRKIRLTEDLHRALERNEFCLFYQPQVSGDGVQITGIEALIRWKHPEFGIISPGVFIPLAEQGGLIISIGDWVLKEACMQCHKYHVNGFPKLRVAVNVSILQIRNPGFVNRVEQILNESNLEPSHLELELTESIVMKESENFIKILNSLKILGVTISIDDFGTEYSSLGRLCDMPIDKIKLDMQFISVIGQTLKGNAIVRGIIELAHNLDLRVIAEGVESKIQHDFLKSNRIDEIQGFYFYKPLPAADISQALLNNCV